MLRTKLIGASVLLAAAAALAAHDYLVPDPHATRVHQLAKLKLASRAPYVGAPELLDAIYNNQLQLLILDVRSEADYNLFHITDSTRVTPADLSNARWLASLPTDSVKLIVSNGERAAGDAWMTLADREVSNIYILEGGMNRWIQTYGAHGDAATATTQVAIDPGDEVLHHAFAAALGDRQVGAEPHPHAAKATYTAKIKPPKPVAKMAAGCGG